jgi:ribosomal protein S18 acetylase RimI-like enzyme
MVRRLVGSAVTEHDHHLVVRSPDNPQFYWGNFLLLDAPPAPEEMEQWIARFAGEFPGAGHVTLGIDGTEFPAPLSYPSSVGLEVDLGVVLTRDRPLEPVPTDLPGGWTIRELRTADDWHQELLFRQEESAEQGSWPPHHAEFLERSTAEAAGLVDRGAAAYFGAFDGERLGSVVGIASDGRGVARFQSVATRADHRKQGLASRLVGVAGEFGVTAMGAELLVIVADHDSAAARLYRSLGFSVAEAQLGLSVSTGAPKDTVRPTLP